MLTVKQLRYFVAVQQHRHFGNAAENVCVSQPALSMQIRDMEKELGLSLMERNAHHVRLTPEGEEVAERANEILRALQDLRDYAEQVAAPLSGQIRLGVIPSLAPYILPKLLPVLATQYPKLQLDLRETVTATLIAELKQGHLDVVLAALPVDEAGLEELEIFEDHFLLAVSSARQIDERTKIGPGDLAKENLLLLEEGHCLRDQTLSFCGSTRQSGTANVGATSIATVLHMVAAGYGVTVLPQICADTEIADDRITLLRFAEPKASRRIGLIWRKTSPKSQDYKALAACLHSITNE
ncbi:Hydrogen peroxide-inducible genes activator [Pseudovibrio axinellae]|uniref:Hydrogen peroxide-inducible genes activator n=1 Tax=Pseudovibrio axinellae TaxID=989403 RepID=A0A166ATF7_9HYPH|nr:hydrogen peroxide-inducible genes activator [Pseudovibrio axinellae]KZL21528.1 Hydrogen peroxide-inducible genes activator [Pseudovibrio axinellae]SER08347.1 transcriptional regulator, LysR family [Pseudovibrio axinellae]